MSYNEDLKLQVERLARFWIASLLRGSSAQPISSTQLVEDRRRAPKVIRLLVEQCYGTFKESAPPTGFFPSSRAFDEVKEEKPDLTTWLPAQTPSLKVGDLDKIHGAPLYKLSLANAKWIVLHGADYSFLLTDPNDYRKLHYATFGVAESFISPRQNYNDILTVNDEAFRTAKEKLRRALYFRDLRELNLKGGMVTLGIISPVDADAFRQDSGYEQPGDQYFGHVPEEWRNEAIKIVDELRQRIAADTRKVNIILSANNKIHLDFGGWEGWLKKYDEMIRTKVDAENKRKTEEPK